jgi:hypothetical protein
LDSKKKEISVHLKFSNKTGKPYFEIFVQALVRSKEKGTVTSSGK